MSSGKIYVMEDDESSGSEEISDSEIDSFLLDKDLVENALAVPPQEFLFAPQAMSESVVLPDFACLDPDTQDRLQALLQAAGITKVANEGRAFGDHELLKRLTSSVSSALDEAAAALTRMKNDDKNTEDPTAAVVTEMSSAEEGESLLSLACSAGYYELAQVLLAMRTNVEDRGSKGDCTPLMEAASAGHADIVKLLIAHGADMTAQSSTGNTPLMYACASGHEEVVRVLLKAGADVSLHNENGHTPLMESASAGHVGIAKLLVDHGAQVNAHSAEFKVGLESPLTLACYKGHLEMVRYLLQVGGDNQSPGRQEELHTALMEASMDGHVEVARLLLDAGAQVNLPTDSFESPLTLAACGGHVELATLLLERGANLEEPNDEGYTPLMEAAREGHEETVTVLLDWGAFVNAQTEETGETALTLACCGGFQEVAVLLLDHGADIELGANTPLMEAAQEGHVDLVRFLVKRGANVNASTASGDTPLTYAAENGHTDVCTALLEAGANLEQVAEGGRTALMKASRAGHLCTVQYLLSKGADPNKSTSGNDHCPLSLACGGGHLTVVELLLTNGADPTKKLKDGTTCIMEAAKGGHTTVVQLLIDWPTAQLANARCGLQLPVDPNSAHAALPPPPPTLQLPSCAEGSNANLTHSISVDNVLPQFLPAMGVAPNYNTLGYPTAALNVGVGQQNQQSDSSFLAYKDPLTQAEKALLKQASEKLSAAELQQLQELLKAQFQETAAQLANRVQATNTSNLRNVPSSSSPASHSTSSSSTSSSSSSSSSNNAKSKKAELEAAMKELEQLKKTQQLYEQLQRALEQKDEKSLANKQNLKSKIKCGQQQIVTKKESSSQSSFALPPVPPPSPPPPPPPPPTSSRPIVPGSDVQQQQQQQQNFPNGTPIVVPQLSPSQQQMLSFQLPALDPAQLQYLQQQFNLTFSSPNFPFQLHSQQQQQTPSAIVSSAPSTPSLMFPNLPTNLSIVSGPITTNDDGNLSASVQLPSTNDSSNIGSNSTLNVHHNHPNANVYVPLPIQLPPDLTSALNANNAFSQLNQTASSTVSAAPSSTQTNAFNFSLPSSGFNFTPAHLLPPHTPTSASSTTTTMLNNLQNHNTVYCNVPNGSAKSTQTSILSSESSSVYHPQFGAFQPPGAYMTQQDLLNQTAAALAGGGGGGGGGVAGSTATNLQQQIPQHLLRSGVDLNTQTESNHDTALTLACAGGHEELVMLLLQRGADLEHQDKKGFTPLILAATAGHAGVVELLLDHGASPEAQSERTKDTALSLACSSGKKEVVEILLKRGTNKEHRNVSDYTPLSLAASGGYTEIISQLLQYGAEINSRTGSKLGISPLMLAAMNGHVAAVKLLLEKGADINAQIETNRNTALTLACFQGRNEVVKLLLEYGANVEHRAKTGLTPLMEAASGGYVEVGRVLLHYGADPNCAPVPASRDTALTIAADKGHAKFVELLLQHGAQLDCKTKKGCTALWLACHGGYLEVVQALIKAGAAVDAQDNRKVTPLMAAFRKGHLKVVKWLVRHVQQFPSDTECTRYLTTIVDKDTLVKCKQCMETIMAAKDRQALEANKAAAVLLQELEHEQQLAETRRQAKQRQKEKKKAKRRAKKAAQRGPDDDDEEQLGDVEGDNDVENEEQPLNAAAVDKEIFETNEMTPLGKQPSKDSSPEALKDSASSQASSSRSSASASLERGQKRRDVSPTTFNDETTSNLISETIPIMPVSEFIREAELDEQKRVPTCPKNSQHDFPSHCNQSQQNMNAPPIECGRRRRRPRRMRPSDFVKNDNGQPSNDVIKTMTVVSKAHQQRISAENAKNLSKQRTGDGKNVDHIHDADGWSKATTHRNLSSQPVTTRSRGRSMGANRASSTRQTAMGADENANVVGVVGNGVNSNVNWREVKRQSHRIYVSSQAIARVIGRGGNNINAIRESSGAHIEVEKQQKGQTDRLITIRGSSDATKQAILMINGLINEPETPVQDIVTKVKSKDTKALECFSHARGSTGVTNGSNSVPLTVVNTSKIQTTPSLIDKFNGFPEMTVWDPTTTTTAKHKHVPKEQKNIPSVTTQTTLSGVTYTTATVLAKNTTVVSSAKGKTETSASSTAVNTKASASPPNSMIVGMEYSPFSTPNVWFNRTSSSNAPQKMNFASVAAANIATTSTTSSAMSVRVSSPLSMCLPNSNSVAAHQIHHRSSMPTSSEINGVGCEIIGDDQRKAPGYRNKYIPPSPTTTTNVSFAVPPPNLHQQSHSLLTDNSNGAQDWYAAPSSNHQRTSSDYRGNEILSSPSTKIQQQPQRAFTPPPSMHATEPVSNGISSGMSSFYDSSSSRQQPFLNAAFDSDGRRSAGTLSGYFSPISLPRPASATATVNVPTDLHTSSTGGMYTPPSPVHNNLLHQQQQQQQQFQNFILPTPIGGERRSRGPSTVPTALANVFGDLVDQHQHSWDTANRLNSTDLADWSSGFSGLSANLAQLQALQAMDGTLTDFSMYNNETSSGSDLGVGNGGGIYEPDYYHPAMWLAAYHQNYQQQSHNHLPPPPPQHQSQQRFAPPPPPPSFTEPPPSAYGSNFGGVPADPWNGQTVQQPSWKMMNGNPSSTDHQSNSSNFVHQSHIIGHPPLPQPPSANHYRTNPQMSQQHGWSGWNSVAMQ